MREIFGHTSGKLYLLFLLATIIGLAVAVFMGVTATPEGGEPIVLFGWMTMPLVVGFVFVILWLIAYLVYFFFFWPFR